MTKEHKKTAAYSIIKGEESRRYQFFCDLSGALVCTTEELSEPSAEDELNAAWEKYGKKHFNRCHKCKKWVIDAMYNPDVLACVKCAPIEDYPEYCPKCGAKVVDPSFYCHMCRAKLLYGGERDEDEASESD